jgi:hypothetical protein
MGRTRVACLIRYGSDSHASLKQQFLYPLNLLLNMIFFDSAPFHLRKKAADSIERYPKLVLHACRQFEPAFGFRTHMVSDSILDPLKKLSARIGSG